MHLTNLFVLLVSPLLLNGTAFTVEDSDTLQDLGLPSKGDPPDILQDTASVSKTTLVPERKISQRKHQTELICKEVCQNLPKASVKKAKFIKFKSYDPSTESCVCTNFRGADIKRKLYKGVKPQKKLTYTMTPDPVTQTELQAKKERKGRQVTVESIADTGEKIVSLPSSHGHPPLPMLSSPLGPVIPGRIRQGGHYGPGGGHGGGPGGGYGGGGGYHGSHGGDFSHGPHDIGCTPLSCVDSCPHHCDSLCRYSGECYCSCPEDLSYEYYEDPGFSLGSLFG